MTTRAVRRLALGAVACVALTQGAASAADPLRLTQPSNATKSDLNPGRTYSAPSLLVNPDDDQMIVGGFGDFRTKQCGLVRSTDGGTTWTIVDAVPNLTSYPYCLANNSNIFQATLAWGRDNTLYMGMVAWDTQDTRSKASVVVARSEDLGDTWTTTLVRDARPTADTNQESNRPITGLVVDIRGSQDVVYIGWRRGFQNQPAGNAKPGQPAVAVSTDGARTFGEPISLVSGLFEDPGVRQAALTPRTTAVPNPSTTTTLPPEGSLATTPDNVGNFGGTNFGMTIDNKGTVYAMWRPSSSNISPSIPGNSLYLAKSSDRGQTWTNSQVLGYTYEPSGNVRVAWGSKGGSAGTLHLVYEFTGTPSVNNYRDIYYQRSTDGGQTWSEARSLSDDDPKLVQGRYIPNVSTSSDGRVDVAWWDTRNDPGIRANDVYYTYSNDNGETWSANIRVTDQTIDRRFGVWGNNFDQNSPVGMASTKAYAVFAWDDTRSSRGEAGEILAVDPTTSGEGIGGGVQDIFVSAVQFTEVGSGSSSTAKAVLAGVVGLVAVGLVLLVVVGAGRSGPGGGPSAARTSSGSKKAASVK